MINNVVKIIKGFTDLPEEEIKEMNVEEVKRLLEEISLALKKGREVVFAKEVELVRE